jgi:hypothetical protein
MTAAPRITLDDAIATHGRDAMRTPARHHCWRVGDLSYLLHAGQLEALARMGASKRRRFVVDVGRRWGKSRLMCVLAVWLMVLRALYRKGKTREQLHAVAPAWLVDAACRTKRKARVLYAAPTADMIEEFVAPHMDLLAEHAPPELRPALSKGDYVMPDGDRIVMKGCEDRARANRLRGPEADLAIVDEAGFVPILRYVLKSAIGFQLAETRGKLLLASTPPDEPDHPYEDVVREAEEAGAYYHATTEDAPHITADMLAEVIEEVGGRDTVDYQREALAMHVRDPSIVVLPEFGDHLVRIVERPAYFLPCIIGDLGFVDMAAVGFGYYHFPLDLYVIEDEVAGQRMVSDALDFALRRKAETLWPRMKVHRRRLDSTARERADLSKAEWQSDEAEGGEDVRWGAVTRDASDTDGRMRALANRARVICKEGRLAVHPQCTTIVAHMKHARWNLSRTSFVRVKDERGEPVHHYDGCAAGLYFLRDCDASANPWPKLAPGVHDDTHHIPEHLKRSEASKLRAIFGRRNRR